MAGCKKSLNYNYAFNVNGSAYQGDNYTAVYQYDTAAALWELAANFYINSAVDTNYVQVSFSGNHYITPGTYYSGVTYGSNTLCSFAYNKGHNYYSVVSGIVQIVQADTIGHVLKGNFQFTAANMGDTINISNGAFAGINYVIE
jgi:hypothetical protein